MGTKYTIEVEDKPFELLSEDGFTSEKLYRVKGFNSLVFDWNGLNMLTPYTEPDTEAICNEAYQKGYSEGCDAKFRRLTGSEYQRGLSDAWAAAKLIHEMDFGERECVFERHHEMEILEDFSAFEAIKIIRQYEEDQKKQEEIKVGDEVVQHIESDGVNPEHDENAIILSDTGCDSYYVMYNDGLAAEVGKEELVRKTGRHFPEIAEALQKMKETTT